MCGIAGILTISKENYNFHKILKEISHPIRRRGPDNYGAWSDGRIIGMAHQRLSVIDLSSFSNQPMISKTKNFVISYNGEIYNYLDLKKELLKNGVKFFTTSDTEVLINACEYWGVEKTLNKIEGMFSFALWNNEQKKLYLARDRIGEKPLYWSKQGKHFYFGSQVSSIVSNPLFEKKINNNSMSNFIYRGVFDYNESIYQDIQQIEPGSYLSINSNFKIEINKYWNLFDQINIQKNHLNNLSYEDIKKNLHELINDSVKKTMIADVPLGCFLSGGIDSSLIASIMQKNSSKKIETFSIGFENKNMDESKFASQIAKSIGTSHNELIVEPKDILDIVSEIPKIYDEPFADSSQLPTFILSKFTREKVKVSLSGDGGDELFGGYNRYNWHEKIKKFNSFFPYNIRNIISNILTKINPEQYDRLSNLFIPNKLRPSMLGDKIYKVSDIIKLKDNQKIYEILTSFWPEEVNVVNNKKTNLNYYDKLDNISLHISDLLRLQLLDLITYLPNDILTKVDRASMYNSLEVRVPFLNHNIIEYALNIKDHYKVNKGNTKIILKDILSEYVPYAKFNRPKMGFAVPLANWFREDLRDWAQTFLNEKKLKKSNLNSELILKRWNEHISGKRNWQYSLWNIIILQSWRDHWNI